MKIRRLIELTVLFPVGGILILAGISFSLPGHRCARPNANESAAIATLRNLHSAQEEHRAARGGFADFAALVEGSYLSPSFRDLDDRGVATRSGYRFRMEVRGGDAPGFAVVAWPLRRSENDRRTFFLDATGRILATEDDVDPWGAPPAAEDARFREVR